jgi:DNA-binding MarR family transcriptional regulator
MATSASCSGVRVPRKPPKSVATWPRGNGELRQQVLAESLGWDKSRLSHHLTRMQQRGLIERREVELRVVMVVLTRQGRAKLEASRPVHVGSVRRHLLSRLSSQQTEMIVRVSNLLGDEDE